MSGYAKAEIEGARHAGANVYATDRSQFDTALKSMDEYGMTVQQIVLLPFPSGSEEDLAIYIVVHSEVQEK